MILKIRIASEQNTHEKARPGSGWHYLEGLTITTQTVSIRDADHYVGVAPIIEIPDTLKDEKTKLNFITVSKSLTSTSESTIAIFGTKGYIMNDHGQTIEVLLPSLDSQ